VLFPTARDLSRVVEFLGERYPVTVACNDSTPVFDPENARVKA
jgi:hypothetical protein